MRWTAPAAGKVSGGQKRHTRNSRAWQSTIGCGLPRRGQKRHTCVEAICSATCLWQSSDTQCQLHSMAEIRGLEQHPPAHPAESNPIFGNSATVCSQVVALCGSVQRRLCRIVQNIKAVFTHTRPSIVDGAAFRVRMPCSPAACAAPVRRLGGRDIQADPIHVVKSLQHVSFHHVQLRGSHGHEWRTEKSHHQQPVLTGQIIWTECVSWNAAALQCNSISWIATNLALLWKLLRFGTLNWIRFDDQTRV